MNVLISMPKSLIRDVEKLIREFLWKGRKPKVALDILHTHKNIGGLKLVNFQAKDMALKIQWISMYFKEEEIRNLANLCLIKEAGECIWIASISPNEIRKYIKSGFWFDVFKAWQKIIYCKPTICSEIRYQPLWLNSFIKIKGKLVQNQQAYR